MNKLCITSNPMDLELLQDWCKEQQLELVVQPFIQFHSIPFQWDSDEEVVFFSSPRSVSFFATQELDRLRNKLLATIGASTAAALQNLGLKTHFVGEKSGTPDQVAQEFKAFVGEKKVLFPCSTKSLKSIASVFSPEQVRLLEVYATEYLAVAIEPCSIYVFTSPSNVRGFLQSNQLGENATIVAWGTSTERSLLENGITPNLTLAESSVTALLEKLTR